jgi:hypothetical protein
LEWNKPSPTALPRSFVTRNGDPLMAILSVEGMDQETLSLSTNPDFLALLEDSRARYRTEGGLSTEEVRPRLGLPEPKRRRRPNKRKR